MHLAGIAEHKTLQILKRYAHPRLEDMGFECLVELLRDKRSN